MNVIILNLSGNFFPKFSEVGWRQAGIQQEHFLPLPESKFTLLSRVSLPPLLSGLVVSVPIEQARGRPGSEAG